METKIYKLLIADDEYWTREKIRNMLDWKEYNIEFMTPAQDGEEVLRILEKDQADILISDVNMPFVNGVELVRKVKELYPDIVVFIISGYDDFEYVRETLLAGAIHYLLKPVSKIDMIGAISKALEIISQREENRIQIMKSASLLQDREMSLLVEKEQMMLSPTMMTYAGEETVGLSVMLIKIHELQELMSKYEYDMNLLSYSLKHLMREVSGLEHLQIFNYIFRSNEFLIVTDLEPAKQKRLAVQLLDCLKNQTTSPVTIAVSEKLYSIESIHNGYVQSISVLMTRPYTKDSIILFCKNEKEMTDHPIHNRVTSEVERQLIGLLKAGNQKAVLEYIQNKVGLKNCATLFRDYLEVKQTTKRITTILMEYLLLESANEKAARELEELDQMLDKGLEKLDADLLCELIGEMLQIVCADKKSEITGNVRDIVKEAVSYIDENYYEELTLASLAEKYCVESSYFSRIFKQEIGDNLMLYITQKRVDKAKELMRQTDINMAEIAFMVGYDDYTYFSKVFKKVTGKSPREYRTCL